MNVPILDNWNSASSLGTDSVLRNMPEGWHPVKVEWYNGVQYGGIQWGWHEGAGGLPYLVQTNPASEFPNPPCQQAQEGPYAQVCDNGNGGDLVPQDKLTSDLTVDLDNLFETGTLYSSANDKTVNFPNFNDRLTKQANRGDAVGVRWGGEINIPADGQYTFYFYHKDGVKFYIDNEFTPKVEDWEVEPLPADLTSYTATLEKGYHAIKIEYFKGLDVNRDNAVMEFGWNYPDPTAPAMSAGPGHIVTEQYLRSYPTSTTGFVARECRSYPQSDSLVCDYEDSQSGVLYRGWKGYCVEKDPRDPSVCLNWWPIDALSGEVNIFADQDLSLTRSPLYYCAETRKKPAPFALPRYVCLSHEANNGPDRCNSIGVVDKLRAEGYGLTSSDWEYGSSDYPTVNNWGWGEQNGKSCFNTNAVDECCLIASNFNGLSGDCSYNDVLPCYNDLLKYYDHVYVYSFQDDKSSANRCENDAWQDDGPNSNKDDCVDSNGGDDDCQYRRSSDIGNMSWGGSSGTNLNTSQDQFDAGANWQADESFPRQCTTIIQVTKADGTSVPWTARIQSGLYGASGEEHPLLYSLGTACAPYGGVPVISKPSDIVNCVPNPTNPPWSGCIVTSGVCSKVDETETGECIPTPLEIYHPNNPDNSNVSQICSETRLGVGFYSCGGTDGICKTCIGGDRNG
ncbi:MAG: hypothetical protein COT25_02870, partial [Candidatus Kerfeldbacteria bacterium CG08_land_8_20_14_0_20_42_7]